MNTKLLNGNSPTDSFDSGAHVEDPDVGKWYWFTRTVDKSRWNPETEEHEPFLVVERQMVCVTHVGTNYIEVRNIYGSTYRLHIDNFWTSCEFIPNPDTIIDGEVSDHQTEVMNLMGKVREVTARLAISNGPVLPGHSETAALVLRSNEQPVEEYKTALTLAKEKTLPDLFKQIEETNSSLASWMKAKLIPLKAQAEGMKDLMGSIQGRIFNVELYAGLVEKIEQCREGEAAPLTTPIHLMQRRAYMDEECLANYKAGGMEFKDIYAFDRWLAEEENLNRILPFPRCIIAFRVRRHEKERQATNIRQFIAMCDEKNYDKLTFLYIRNGEQLFRLNTGIEFDAKLFPDTNRQILTQGKLWAKVSGSKVRPDEIISNDEYQSMAAEHVEHERKVAEAPESERWHMSCHCSFSRDRYEPFTQESVYFDDIAAAVKAEIDKHNRLVLVLQGLLDRSPVLHPHPAWSLWTHEGFTQGLSLVYDESRTLTTGEAPDFEAYRARLNRTLRDGSVTVGQEVSWEYAEARKENERRDRSRGSSEWRPDRFRPHGDDGPGTLARVVKYSSRTQTCNYEWLRERRNAGWSNDEGATVRGRITVKTKYLLNVDAYQPGDFKQFFNDPRTRADYLQWAPLLLEAEEYHAGNRKVIDPPAPPPPKESSEEGKWRYQQLKEQRETRKLFDGKAVRLTRPISTKSGKLHHKGSLWKVVNSKGSTFDIQGIDAEGRHEERWVVGVSSHDMEVDEKVTILVNAPDAAT